MKQTSLVLVFAVLLTPLAFANEKREKQAARKNAAITRHFERGANRPQVARPRSNPQRNANPGAAAAARSPRGMGAAGYNSDIRVGRGARPVITRTERPNSPVARSNEARVFTPNQPRFNATEGPRRGGNRNGLGRNRGGRSGDGSNRVWDGGTTPTWQGGAGNENTVREGRRGGGRHQRFHDRHEGDPNFRQAHRRWHRQHQNRSWWRSRYNRFALFGGGYYYFNSGYWYPAYGYDPYYSSYTYDAPLYGYNGLEPGQVIASVQAELQRLGYNPGGVDGSFGPRTRRALIDFQQDNGLSVTGEIDQETLNALGLE